MSADDRNDDDTGHNHVSVRLDRKDIARLDALLDHFSQPWAKATRSDVLRAVILKGLTASEAEAAKKPKS